jgi:predicted dehydrogenase
MKGRIGIGFIGAGEVSVMHGRGLRDVPSCELVGLWNRTAETARRRAREEGCCVYATPQELVEDPKIQAVLVLTNLETHLAYARMAMEAGKHVLVEKPLCANLQEIREMIACRKKTGVVCMPGHNYIHEDGLARAAQMTARGELGKVVSCYVLYNIHHSEERASTLPGVVRQILTHNLYTMMYLVGRPARVSAFKANRHYERIDKEDIALVNVELENGGLAHLCASFAADDLSSSPWSVYVKVIGTQGTTQYSYNDWVGAGRGLSHSRTFVAYQETLTREVRYFVEKCIGEGLEPPSTLEDALWAQAALEAIELSLATGSAVKVAVQPR